MEDSSFLTGTQANKHVFLKRSLLCLCRSGGRASESDALGQTETFYSVAALLESFESRQPIVLVAENGYAKFPYDLGQYMYVILGLYQIVDAWGEPVC